MCHQVMVTGLFGFMVPALADGEAVLEHAPATSAMTAAPARSLFGTRFT
jgi:hypothetical protein